MSLFSALDSTASALSAFEGALTVIQNNINNSSTPGYASQSPNLEALPFNEASGEVGGVTLGASIDSRSTGAEENVQANQSQSSYADQQVSSLTSVQNLFDISGNTGIPKALSNLYSAFSTWSSSPSSATSQQGVLTAANSVAQAFNDTAQQVQQVASQTDSSTSAVVSQINALAAKLSGFNSQIAAGDTNDPGLNAAIYNTLQQLSQLANISTISAPNGTVTVLLGGGETALVNGVSSSPISVAVFVAQPPPPTNPNGPPSAHITDAQGHDITSAITGGQLGSLLNVRNNVLPGIQGDANSTGSLNQLAAGFASRINSILTAGQLSAGPPPVPGVPLFTYDPSNATNSAASLSVSSSITPSQLAAGNASSSNAVALQLANLENSTNSADQINGQTYSSFYGSIASSVGQQLSTAQSDQTTAQDSLTQAESIRQSASGVDLNQQAAQVLQFQQAYDAAAKVISVIDDLTQTAIGLIQPASS